MHLKRSPALFGLMILLAVWMESCGTGWSRSVAVSQIGAEGAGTTSRPAAPASSARRGAPAEPARDANKPPRDPRSIDIWQTEGDSTVSWEGFVSECARANVVLVGEVHGHELCGRVMVALFEDLAKQEHSAPVLSLEFFDRDEQVHLDDYLSDVTDEEAFKKASGRSEGNFPEAHRELINLCKVSGFRAVATNAPRRYVRLARTSGIGRLHNLTVEQSRLVSTPASLTQGAYRDRFFELMQGAAGHGDGSGQSQGLSTERVEGFFLSQNVWDATMADSIDIAHHRGGKPVFHVVGQFHTDFDGGLTQRVVARLPGAQIVTISLVDEDAATLREEDRERATFVVYVGKE